MVAAQKLNAKRKQIRTIYNTAATDNDNDDDDDK